MNILEFTKIITVGKVVVDWIEKRGKAQNELISSYLDYIQKSCQELIVLEDIKSDQAYILHEQLKIIYDMASSKLPSEFINDRRGLILYRALSSARIYYWIRLIESYSDYNELLLLLNDRNKLSLSLDRLVNLLRKSIDSNNKGQMRIQEVDILRIRKECLYEIAQLSLLKEQVFN